MEQIIERFLDEEGRVKQWPSKASSKQAVLQYLCGKFEPEGSYGEREVNALLTQWHTFGDFFLLRRELVNSQWLMRLPDGSKYWVNPAKQGLEAAE